MKKIKEGKENKRNGANFFKYIHPQPSPQTKLHSRSLIQLEPNTSRYQQSARIPSSRDIHHSSVCGVSQGVQSDTIKSNSLKKFLSIFGGPANLNNNSCGRSSGRGDQKSTQKTSGRQVFTCNIKNMNVNVTNSKDKQIKDHRTLLVMKRDKMENHYQTNHQPLNRTEQHENTILELRKTIDEAKETEILIRKQLQQIVKQNSALKRQLEKKQEENQILQQRISQKQTSLSKKIEFLQNSLASKEKCREHELIIESLKKVINEQLRKIIQLQKSKIQREQIEKLEERINKNINLANENSVKQKLKLIQNEGSFKMKRKEGTTIKIEDQSFESAISSPTHELETYQDTIQQATQEEERGSQSKNKEHEQGDSILEQVDKYLALWRSKA